MSLSFYIVYQALEWLAAVTGLTYEAVNVIVYYGLVPAIFCALIDKIIGKPVCLSVFAIALLIAASQIRDFATFSERLFDGSVAFLLSFSKIGLSYDLASVLICVLLPILVFVTLCVFAFPDWCQRHLPTVSGALNKSRDHS